MQKLGIGIDFGGTSVKIGVVEGKEIIHESSRIDPQGYTTAVELIAILAETVLNLKELFPGVESVDYPSGTIHNLTNVDGWVNVGLKAEIEERTGLKCAVENDANCMALAEWKLGAGQGFEHLVCLTLGTGVGGGIILNNQMVRGARYAAGELGQASINYEGVAGHYGNHGALEKYIGNRQISEFVQRSYAAQGIEKQLTETTPYFLSKYADDGCKIALECWDVIAKMLATGVANACWLMNPQAVVIGGGVANADEHLFVPFEKHLHSKLSDPFKEALTIRKAHFGNEAGMLGSAILAQELPPRC